MAVRLSKEITDRVRECDFVLSAFRTEGSQVAETLTGLTQPNLEETDAEPGYGTVFVGMSRNVAKSLDNLVAADARLSSALGWESTLRKEHNEKSEAQGFALVSLRRTVIGHFVDPDLENLSLQPVDVRDSVTVARRSQLISERFEAPNLARMLGQARFAEVVDLTPYVTQIRTSARELRELGAQINEAERRTSRARLEKNKLQSAHDKLVLRSARVLEDFCRLAGDDELADRIRRTVRSRPSGQDSGEGEGGEGEGGDVADPIGDVPVSPEGEEASQEA